MSSGWNPVTHYVCLCMYAKLWILRNGVAVRGYKRAFLCVCGSKCCIPLSLKASTKQKNRCFNHIVFPILPSARQFFLLFSLSICLCHTHSHRLLFLLFFRKDENRWPASKSPIFPSVHLKTERFSEIRMSMFKCSEKWTSPWQILF